MNTIEPQRLAELVVETLERTAFLIADAMPPGEHDEFDRPSWFSTIQYQGAENGRVFLSASEGFVRELASSLLGVEPEDVDMESQGRDAINELANIVGGCVTMELGGQTKQISLGLPEPSDVASVPKASDAVTQCFVESEDELLVITHLRDAAGQSLAA